MPNGSPDFHKKDLPILEQFFTRISPDIQRFAEQHNLSIDRYYHQLPSWTLRFAHPHGGAAYVEVRRVDDNLFQIMMSWHVDDYDRATRFVRSAVRDPLSVDGTDIESVLRDALTEALSWQPGAWSNVYDGYDEWHKIPKTEFEKMSSVYPIPRT